MSTSFTEEANQYILKAHAIKQTYFPPTGNLLTFGANECGQLAQHEDIGSRMRPTVVLSSVRNIGVTQIACGALHNILLTDLGKVLSWGCNDEGSLGAYETSTAYAPMEVLGFIPASRELGTNLLPAQYTWTDLKHSKSDSDFKDPTKISKMFGKYGERIVSISSGDTQCLALSENGRVHMWGAYKDTEGMAWGDVPPKDDPRRYPDYVVDLEALEEDRIADPNTFAGVRGKRHWPVHVWQLGGKASQISCGFAFNAAVVEKDVGGIKKSVCITWGLGQNGELSRPVTKDLKMPKGTFDDLGEKEYSLAMAKNPYMKYNVDTVEEDYMMPKEVVWADGNSDRIVEKVVCGGYRKFYYSRLGSSSLLCIVLHSFIHFLSHIKHDLRFRPPHHCQGCRRWKIPIVQFWTE
jgi:alpha-tubulin suppressor-like RCC1 family protein